MSIFDEVDARRREAVRAVLDMADSNFPSNTNVTIRADGSNSASVTLPAYVLRGMLKAEDNPNG